MGSVWYTGMAVSQCTCRLQCGWALYDLLTRYRALVAARWGGVVVSRRVERVTRHLHKLHSMLRLATSSVTHSYSVSTRRCHLTRAKRFSVSIDVLRGVTQRCNVSLSTLVFKRRPGVDSCFLAHTKGKADVRHAGTCGCRSLTTNFVGHATSPFVIAMRPGPSDRPVRCGDRANRRFGLMLRNHVVIDVSNGSLVLGRKSDLCFGSGLPRNVGTLSKGAMGFLTMVVWWDCNEGVFVSGVLRLAKKLRRRPRSGHAKRFRLQLQHDKYLNHQTAQRAHAIISR